MKKTSLTAVFLGLLTTDVMAGVETGTVDYVISRASDGLTYFNLVGTTTGAPSCANKGYWIIKDENSEVGKKQYSMILAAAASGKSVTVRGSNTCTRWGDGEDVDSIQFRAE